MPYRAHLQQLAVADHRGVKLYPDAFGMPRVTLAHLQGVAHSLYCTYISTGISVPCVTLAQTGNTIQKGKGAAHFEPAQQGALRGCPHNI